MNFIENLNESQQKAVLYNDGPHLIVAGAGAGKTRVLTYKIAYLLSQGVSSSAILALTFTNKAAREMKDRIGKLVGEQTARYMSCGTFHSVFSRILRQECQALNMGYTSDFTIYDTTDSKSLLKQLIKELGLEEEKAYKVGDVLGYISEAKNNLISVRDYFNNRDLQLRDRHNRLYRLADIYQLYQARLRQANAMDFDDLLFNMNLLLANCPEVRAKYQDIFQYILVDEYQDTNYSQYTIIRCLAEPQRHICVVGDDAQSIYAFRGADIRNILQFQQEYQGCPIFKLERNYRSTQNIVNAANSLIRKNIHQIPKNVYSENGVGDPVQISSHGSDRDEGRFLAEKALFLHRCGRDYEDMAVLYRTNAQSRVIEDELRKLSIPYRIYGGVSFYQRKEIKDVLSYFRLITNPQDDEAFRRIINFPARKIGDTTVNKVAAAAIEKGESLFEAACHPAESGVDASAATHKKLQEFARLILGFREESERLDAYTFAQHVVKTAGITAALAAGKTQEEIDRYENVQELLSALREFVELNDAQSSIRDFLSEVALLTDQDTHQSDQSSRLTLMTIHSAKGLEYGVIMIAGLEENLFPSMFCEAEKEIEEERRLFYVAITRAKDECYITSAKTRFRNGQLQFQTPSRFLKDLDPRYVQRSESIQRSSWESSNRYDDFGFSSGSARDNSSYSPYSSYSSHSSSSHSRLTRIPSSSLPINGTGEASSFAPGTRVRHRTFGDGTVEQALTDENGTEKVIILFDAAGRKTMILSYAKLEKI